MGRRRLLENSSIQTAKNSIFPLFSSSPWIVRRRSIDSYRFEIDIQTTAELEHDWLWRAYRWLLQRIPIILCTRNHIFPDGILAPNGVSLLYDVEFQLINFVALLHGCKSRFSCCSCLHVMEFRAGPRPPGGQPPVSQHHPQPHFTAFKLMKDPQLEKVAQKLIRYDGVVPGSNPPLLVQPRDPRNRLFFWREYSSSSSFSSWVQNYEDLQLLDIWAFVKQLTTWRVRNIDRFPLKSSVEESSTCVDIGQLLYISNLLLYLLVLHRYKNNRVHWLYTERKKLWFHST